GARRGAQRGGDAGDHLEGDAGGGERLGLLAAAAEQERVAALEAHDALAAAGGVDQRLVYGDAALGVAWAEFSDREAFGGWRDEVEDARRDEGVVEDEIGLAQQLDGSQGQQTAVPGAGADQGYEGGWVHSGTWMGMH